ncbi:uncharacterized protein EDB91DRAFT_1251452 [Suillus paluster]|uniref:uncharacterized protein n=1 Tax=Suillus paluster TaxID=48578 RepID=UPI001B863EFB|nr:uncharacterized protein EDB91DRAFT_1251452 [Suillus paluster]KAG1733209.1 hypothetical protein EDB91DRAFT_1251452 [Suillus paluster]
MSQPDIQCLRNRRVQMLPHPCFTLKQFIEAIRLVQCDHCSHRDVMDSPGDNPTDVDTSIEDIWIGATNDATNDVLPGSQPEYHSSEGEELEAANASAKTLEWGAHRQRVKQQAVFAGV